MQNREDAVYQCGCAALGGEVCAVRHESMENPTLQAVFADWSYSGLIKADEEFQAGAPLGLFIFHSVRPQAPTLGTERGFLMR